MNTNEIIGTHISVLFFINYQFIMKLMHSAAILIAVVRRVIIYLVLRHIGVPATPLSP